MREEEGKYKVDGAVLVVDKFDPLQLIDLYVSEEDMRALMKIFGTNRVTVALRMKGVG